MDHFGIGLAMQGMARVYFQSARRTGRTTSLLDSLKDGDRIWCHDRREAERLQRLCRDRKLDVECFVLDPKVAYRVMERGTPAGRAVFDHTWVEQYYLAALERAAREIDELQQQSSGYGAPHIETRRQAEEIARWRG